ncbi:CipC protein [Rhodotorula diobovata]|uniref:CipC protein n=1 Tax=Rhodotorula diobovata TaxID=5288 RepID=A0A5C5FY71_9BASI|nr:CipC protein [Rhodotorula diobovata]
MFFDDDSNQANAYQKVQDEDLTQHDPSLAHELIAGAAAFEAQKAYMDHKERSGTPENHEMAKELFAGFAAAAVDRLVESKGLDFVDREKAKYDARRQLEEQVSPDRY